MSLFAPGDYADNRAIQAKEALIDATKRGVRVRLFLEGVSGAERGSRSPVRAGEHHRSMRHHLAVIIA